MSDGRLESELKRAYGRDLPGGEFDDAVMERTLAESGGEHEVTIDAPRGRRWWPVAVAAAMVLLLVGMWRWSGPVEQDPPPICVLPELAAPGNERIVVAIDAEGKTSVGGTVLTGEQLKNYLTLRAKECRADGEDEPYVHIEGDLKASSGHIQRFLQLCTDPAIGIRKFQFALAGKFEVVEHRGQEDGPVVAPAEPEEHRLVLKRVEGETATLLFLDGSELGGGEEGLAALAGRLQHTTRKAGEIEAHPLVPHQEIIRAIDAFMKAGIEKITFVGVPPPAKQKPRPALHVHLEPDQERTVLVLYSSGGRMVCELAEGLVALDAAIRKLAAAGPKPAGFLDAPVYIDQDAVTRVLAVFQKHGIEDVTIIH